MQSCVLETFLVLELNPFPAVLFSVYSGFEYITCCFGVFDVASEEQAQDIDPYHIHVCRDCCDNAINNEVRFFLTYFLLHF